MQVGKREGGRFAIGEIVQLEGLEVADQDVSGALVFGQRVEVLSGLVVSAGQVADGALLLDDQDAGPEQVDVPRAFVHIGDVFLVAGGRAPLNAKGSEDVVVKALRPALLVGAVLPLACEVGGAGANLIPGQSHGRYPEANEGSCLSNMSVARQVIHHCLSDVVAPDQSVELVLTWKHRAGGSP